MRTSVTSCVGWGDELVSQAIVDARPPEGWETDRGESDATRTNASAEIALPESDPLKLEVSPAGREPQRLVVATQGDVQHRDRVNTDSSTSRDRFIKKLAVKLGFERDTFAPLVEPQLTKLADEIDQMNPAHGCQSEKTGPKPSDPAANMADRVGIVAHAGHEAYATIQIGDHTRLGSFASQMFKRFMAKQF